MACLWVSSISAMLQTQIGFNRRICEIGGKENKVLKTFTRKNARTVVCICVSHMYSDTLEKNIVRPFL